MNQLKKPINWRPEEKRLRLPSGSLSFHRTSGKNLNKTPLWMRRIQMYTSPSSQGIIVKKMRKSFQNKLSALSLSRKTGSSSDTTDDGTRAINSPSRKRSPKE